MDRGGRAIERHRGALRIGLIALAVLNPLVVGVWGLVAPRAFFRDFPGGGRHWVSAFGAYDEHLVRDFAADELGFAVLLLVAAVLMTRRLVQVALAAWAIAGLPHLIYHATATGHLSTADNLASLAGLALSVIVPLALLALTRAPRMRTSPPAPIGGAG